MLPATISSGAPALTALPGAHRGDDAVAVEADLGQQQRLVAHDR
jgi:hypothetical protein